MSCVQSREDGERWCLEDEDADARLWDLNSIVTFTMKQSRQR